MIDEETANEPLDDDVFNDEKILGRGLTKKLERSFSVFEDLEIMDEVAATDPAEAEDGNPRPDQTRKLERKSSSLALVQFTQSISAINSLVIGVR